MDCRDYLRRHKALQMSIDRLETKIAIEESQAERATSILTGVPRGGGEKFADDLWAKLADSRSEYREKLHTAIKLQRELEEFIASVPGELNQLILQMRYVDCLPWERMADLLNYDARHVQRLHGAALVEARAIYERRTDEDRSIQGLDHQNEER